jgi:hypothetical protein
MKTNDIRTALHILHPNQFKISALRQNTSGSPPSARHGFLHLALALALGSFALLPLAHAVTPAPDGGYANGNTAEGTDALFKLTTGRDNVAVGFDALFNNTTGSSNTAIGGGALLTNAAGSNNTATGTNALFSSAYGDGNTATGVSALQSNTANVNTAVGFQALWKNTSGSQNTATGSFALQANSTGASNTAIGFQALSKNNGFENTAVGKTALASNSSGNYNTAIGSLALFNNTGGSGNTATGETALVNNTTGGGNSAHGEDALRSNSTGNTNAANGAQALYANTSGSDNTAVGFGALGGNTIGGQNIALGVNAGMNLTTGSNNIDVGHSGVAGETGKIRIGTASKQTATFIAGISGVAVTGSQVVVNSSGKLGIAGSSARFKQAIKPMDKTSEAILALEPVTFRYKEEIDPDASPQFGLVAEQVEKVNPDLVLRDAEGKVNTVRYEAVNAMLLNEFLKHHRKVEEQEVTIAQQRKDFQATSTRLEATVARQQNEIKSLTASLREQASKVQKISDQVELSKPAPRMIANNQ